MAVKVLLIEDNQDDAILIKDSLIRTKGTSWEISWAQSLAEGLELAESNPADVLLLDLSLPDSKGFCTFVQAYESMSDLPIILLTGLDDEEIAIQAAQQGAQDYLVKGKVTGDLIVRSIKYAIERHRLSTELRQESQAKSTVLSTATHELKTPLTSIVGYIDRILLSQSTIGPLNERQTRYLETVKRNAHRLKALVDDLLDISRIESGSLELSVVAVDVRQELLEVIQTMQNEIKEKNLNVVLNIAPETTCIMADRLRFSQVISNLVNNACKYSSEGSQVTVSTLETQTAVQMDVSDTGIGISESDQTQLFSKFFRADSAVSQKISGTGLGLYITKHLVNAHGGSIQVQSKLGLGTTFSLTWPKSIALNSTDWIPQPAASGKRNAQG